MMMVTLYKENQLDRAEQRSAEELVVDFVATLRGERYPDYRPSGSWRPDDQFAWWLADPKAENSTWDAADWPILIEALNALMNADVGARHAVFDAINP